MSGRITARGTVFELEHVATVDTQRWTEFGHGAVGVGWDGALLGLGLHLGGGEIKESERVTTAVVPELGIGSVDLHAGTVHQSDGPVLDPRVRR